MPENEEPIIPKLGLLILDIQESFSEVIGNFEELVKRTSFCIETAQLFSLPIIVSEQYPEKLGNTVTPLKDLLKNTPRYSKRSFSALGEETITAAIEENNIEHLLVAGIETPICVYQTAIDAINDDIDVTLLSDAIAARRQEDSNIALNALATHGANILPSETIFYSILQSSSHPLFKKYTALVKKYSD